MRTKNQWLFEAPSRSMTSNREEIDKYFQSNFAANVEFESDYHQYYYTSEMQAAYWALVDLRVFLPLTPKPKGEVPEWGTIIFRWLNSSGGYKYSFQKPYKAIKNDGDWQPLGKIPSYAEERAYAHTHPNNLFFSTTDTNTAMTKRTTMYMVNQTGAYRFDGRTELLSKDARYSLMWGTFPQ